MPPSGEPKTSSPDDPKAQNPTFGSPTSPLAAAAATSSGSSGSAPRARSGELPRAPRPSHRRSASAAATSPPAAALPAGNICPSGKVSRGTAAARSAAVLGSGSTNYGHGSIVRKAAPAASTGAAAVDVSNDPESARRIGNEMYRKGQFEEALRMYEKAMALSPANAASCRSNKAAALAAMGMVVEAAAECEEAVRIDPTYTRAHRRLGALYLRLGQVENARKHLYNNGEQPDPAELQKLQTIEMHLSRSMDARRIADWKSMLRESDAAIAAGADSSTLLSALRAEALLRQHRLDEANAALSNAGKLETPPSSGAQTRFFGMLLNSYVHIVRAGVGVALGRFEDAETSAEKACDLDPDNKEVVMVLKKVRSIADARARGNELFSSGKFADACEAYAEGLELDPCNPVLYCNRAACQSKLGLWERSIADCTEALKIQPSYTKALLRRAASYEKLERWAESVRDYEALRKELPQDNDIAEASHRTQVAWRASRGMEALRLNPSSSVEKITSLEQFHGAISSPGISVVCFMSSSNKQSVQACSSLDALRSRYPSMSFLKADIDECSPVAKMESIRIVPTYKIYKNGIRVKEMICPSQQILEHSLRHYSSI